MKNVLIAGAGSYIGTSVENWLEKYPEKYNVTTLDMMGDGWGSHDFSQYDVIYLVAGIAHRPDAPDQLYEDVNHKMAVEVFKKCCEQNVKQFIFMSSGAVYTQSDRSHQKIVVTKHTPLNPCTAYGKSKRDAEIDIDKEKKKNGSLIKVAVLRPPMVYGKGAKGNYQTLRKIALKTPVFPKVKNARSMIYIDNLCEFIRLVIDNESEGVFLPQNKEYVNTSKLVAQIAKNSGKKIIFTPAFNWTLEILGKYKDIVNKAFGSYVYKKSEFPYFDGAYQVVGFEESIRRTESL